jgi:hypothetical protein
MLKFVVFVSWFWCKSKLIYHMFLDGCFFIVHWNMDNLLIFSRSKSSPHPTHLLAWLFAASLYAKISFSNLHWCQARSFERLPSLKYGFFFHFQALVGFGGHCMIVLEILAKLNFSESDWFFLFYVRERGLFVLPLEWML